MSIIDSLVTVTVTANAATPSVKNTSTPAIIAYHTHNTDLIRTYTDLAGMVSDSFSTHEPAYLMAQSICSQTPRPATFKVIRSTTAVAQTFTFTVTDNTTGRKVGLYVTSPLGVTTDCRHTVASETADQVATAVAALIDALPDIAATATGSVVTATAGTAGKPWYPSAVFGGGFIDTTTTAAPETDLAAALIVDQDWYGISGMWIDNTNIGKIAAWAESNKRFHAYTTADTLNITGTTGIFKTLKDLGDTYSFGQYSGSPETFGALGLTSLGFTASPGSNTFAYKSIAGTSVDALTSTNISNIETENGNYYITVSNLNITLNGINASGLYADLRIGIDALVADMQARVFTLLVRNPKVPYTTKGISAIAAEMSASLQSFVSTGFISNDIGEQFSIAQPAITDVSPIDKGNRVLKNMNFIAVAQGAIQRVRINGTINV